MKKILFFLVIVLVILFLFTTFGMGLGIGSGGFATRSEQTEADNQSEPKDEGQTDKESTDSENEETVLKISVVENDYFYDNERIELDDLTREITEIQDDYIVEIKDEKASKNAYDALVETLDENGINYIEK